MGELKKGLRIEERERELHNSHASSCSCIYIDIRSYIKHTLTYIAVQDKQQIYANDPCFHIPCWTQCSSSSYQLVWLSNVRSRSYM